MKTIIAKLTGEPKPGDFLAIHHSHPVRGGASSILYRVREDRDSIVEVPDGEGRFRKVVNTESDSLLTVRDALVAQVNFGPSGFLPEHFQARPRGDDELVIQCSDTMQDSIFSVTCECKGTIRIALEVI